MAFDAKSMVRIGIVSSLDKEKLKARVFYPDMNDMVSDWLYVLQRPGEHVDVKTAADHKHEAKVTTWMPDINMSVVVLYPYGWNMDGFILGVIP